MQQLVEKRGVRAQLETGSFVTGQRYVRLAFFPDAPKVRIDWTQATPELPTVTSMLPELEAKLGAIVTKLERVPLEAIGDDLKKSLVTLDGTLGDARGLINRIDTSVVPALNSTLGDAKGALGAAQRVLSSTETNLLGPDAPGQIELRNAMVEISRAARSLRVLADFLERHPEALIRGKIAEPAPK
jgi:paraquat-inducible protein B